MFGSNVLDVAIGLVFIYLLISLTCSVINETIASWLNQRGKNLFLGIKNLLNDPSFTGLAQQIYNHGMVDGISQNASDPKVSNRPPSYIPSLNFSLALIDILGAQGVLDAAHSSLLEAAERAEDASQKNPNDADLKAIRATARVALLTARDTTQNANQQAQDLLKATPDSTTLQEAAVKAQRQANIADAAVKMLDARNAAVALSKNPKDVDLAEKASHALEEALSIGRELRADLPASLDYIQAAIKRLPAGHTKESLAVLLDKTRRELQEGENAIEQYGKNVETWFNDAMDRVSGWYKRWTQKILLGISIVLVCAVNVDTIHIVQRLTSDPALRSALVTAAKDVAKNPPSTTQKAQLKLLQDKANTLSLPIGWSSNKEELEYYKDYFTLTGGGPLRLFLKIVGLGISMMAVSLGAPFWFDTLSKFINLRGTGTPPGEKSKSVPKEQSTAQKK